MTDDDDDEILKSSRQGQNSLPYKIPVIVLEQLPVK